VKDRMISLVSSRPAAVDGVNLMREYLQSTVLASMQGSRSLRPLAFHGGTCLRFVHRIGRFSEDLDFALERPEVGLRFADMIARVVRDLTAQGYVVRATVNDAPVVRKAFLGFVGAEYEAGLSPYADKVFRIKIEVDSNPPAGAVLETTSLVSFEHRLRLQHHDLPSLFAGKLAAVLQRQYTKGRDLYDLLWYLEDARRPAPNVEMLANALRQSHVDAGPLDDRTWPGMVITRLGRVDWKAARSDVEHFLERPGEAESLTYETFERLLSARGD
jgi:hypothetical protein